MNDIINIKVLEEYESNKLLIRAKHPTLPISIWNYSAKTQFEKLWDDITLSCRGLITDDIGGYVLARPFKKFFNIEEFEDFEIFDDDFEVFEKMDGSLIILFFAYDQWIVASRGSFISDQSIAAENILKSLEIRKYLDYRFTHLFEYISYWNRIIIDYGNVEKLILLSAIHTHNNYELSYDDLKEVAKSINIEIVKKYDGLKDINKLKGLIKSNHEGFVIRFLNGERLKIKSDEYFKLAKILTNISSYVIWNALKTNEENDLIYENAPDEYFKWIKITKEKILNDFNNLKNFYISEYKKYENITDQKEYALAILPLKNKGLNIGIFFNIKKNQNFDNTIWDLVKPIYELPVRINNKNTNNE